LDPFTPEEQQELLSREVLTTTDSEIYAQAREIADECD
jgi:hypothetical protein